MATTIREIPIDTDAQEYLARGIDADIIRVVHSDPERQAKGIIALSKKDKGIKALLVALANTGYYLYRVTDQFSGLIHHGSIRKRPKLMLDGALDFSTDQILYQVEPPADNVKPLNLLVIFSSMRAGSNLLARHYVKNFETVAKYIPQNTAILRIVDLGSVKGGFYLNTNYLTDNEARIQNLIEQVALGVGARKVLLFGTSKGGTAALYHSVLGGHMAVAVDPIISDAYYVTPKMNDEHFTEGTFPETKQEKFTRFFLQHKDRHFENVSVVYSKRSPQHQYISGLLADPYPQMFSYFNSSNRNINDHPDVAKFTLPLSVSLLSMKLYGLPLVPGRYDIG